jgi:hypothetical protein
MAYLMAKKGLARPKDIVVYTDNETYAGKIHPSVAMKAYRKLVPDATLIVVAATPTKFSIADPEDPGMLDVAGFDTNAPKVIHNFVTSYSEMIVRHTAVADTREIGAEETKGTDSDDDEVAVIKLAKASSDRRTDSGRVRTIVHRRSSSAAD